MRRWIFPLLACASLGACGTDQIDLDPLDDSAPVEASVRPPPISGGTLAVTDDGVAIAADPDRDLVYVVDLANKSVRHTIALASGDMPGRVAVGTGGLAHVVLRGAGAVASIDLVAGVVEAQRAVCPDPRGLAFEHDTLTLHVACADGSLVHVPEDPEGEITRESVAADLRDVVVHDGLVWASRFRAADVVRRDDAAVDPVEPLHPVVGDLEKRPHVAWRTFVGPARGSAPQILMLHQISETRPVPIDGDPTRDDHGDVGGSDLAYGGSGEPGCNTGISASALTILSGPDAETFVFPGLPLAVDAAISPGGDWIALAVPGAPEGVSSLQLTPFSHLCETPLAAESGEGQITAVAFAKDGTLVTQSREPAQLVIRTGSNPVTGAQDVIALSSESRFDTGHEIFHRATESGLSCASCHPEAGDDGHVWLFDPIGHRRTQPLDIGLQGTAPFHWDGDMDDLDMIMDEVMSHRMGGHRQSEERRKSFANWLFAQELPPAASPEDALLVEQGAGLFAAYGCGTCHAGASFMSNETVSLRGEELQVPSLRRISLRPPYMHDGRASTLEHAIIDMVDATAPGIAYTQADVDAIAAFLRTL